MPLVWAVNGEKVDSEKVKRQPELQEFWTKAYKNVKPRMKNLNHSLKDQKGCYEIFYNKCKV